MNIVYRRKIKNRKKKFKKIEVFWQENQKVFDVFRGSKKRSVAWNELIDKGVFKQLLALIRPSALKKKSKN